MCTPPLMAVQAAIVLAFLILLFGKPSGPWTGRRKKLEAEMAAAQVEEIKALSGIGEPANKDFIRDKTYRAIDYAIKRHDWYEDQRSRMFQAIVAICSAIFVVVGIFQKMTDLPAAQSWLIVLGLIAIAFVSLVCGVYRYNEQLDRDRPYRAVSDVRFWYFHYNLDKESGGTDDEQARSALDQRKKFFSRVVENFDPRKSLREDLEQLFILQVLQRYKSESLTKLRWILSYLTIFFGAEIVVFIALYDLTPTSP